MAYTQADLVKLQRAIANGVRKVRMGDEEVEYRSISEMERLESKIKAELQGTRRPRIVQVGTKSGWR